MNSESIQAGVELREAGCGIRKTDADEMDGQAYLWLRLRRMGRHYHLWLRLEGYKDEKTQSSGWPWALNKNLEEFLCMSPTQFNSGAEQRDQSPGFHLRKH